MPNWASTSYRIEGEPNLLQKIEKAVIQHPVAAGADNDWEGNVCLALGIPKERLEKATLRGFISEPPSFEKGALVINAEEAWARTDFAELLKEKFPDITVYWVVEEEGNEIYETNDALGKYFPMQYCVDAYYKGEYYSEYFKTEEEAVKYVKDFTKGEVSTIEKIKNFKADDSHILLYEFKIVK